MLTSKSPDAVLIGSLGCVLGGHMRAMNLHPKRRSEIAKHAAKSRWNVRKSKSNKSK